MRKSRIVLGLLIAMAMVICGTFLTQTPQMVFAEEVVQQNEPIETEAGTFYGQGYYVIGDIAVLKAEMNQGYAFDYWYYEDEGGNEEVLSTSLQYAFPVEKPITIGYKWHKIKYDISFDDNLLNIDKTGLEKFDYEIINKTTNGTDFYYGNEIEISLSVKDGTYIYDLANRNIYINNVNLYNILRGENLMEVECDIENNKDVTGFSNLILTLKILEDIKIDVDYTNMYKLEIVSGNTVEMDDIIQFISVANNYSQPDTNKYVYLVREDKQVNIITRAGNDIYMLEKSQFEGYGENIAYSQSFSLYGDRTFTVTYSKKGYLVEFNSYLNNLYNEQDLLQNPFYAIEPVTLTAGEEIKYSYNSSNREITIGSKVYQYPQGVFGYKFVGFEVNGVITDDATFTLSETEPKNDEIKLIFEYIIYNLDIKLVDEYFTDDDVVYGYKYDTEQLITGTKVILNASTTKYTINGWSYSNNPKQDGYIEGNEITFSPVSDDNTQDYIIYLDIDYKYLTSKYNLRSNSIVKNAEYDVVVVDFAQSSISFSDSENLNTQITEQVIISDYGTKQVISTVAFGDIVIENNTLKYVHNYNNIVLSLSESQGDLHTYSCEKYTYFGDLQLGLVEYITLSDNNSNVNVVLGGSTFGDNQQSETVIQTFTTSKTEIETGIYSIAIGSSEYKYQMSLVMNGAEYDYISLRDVKYYYNSANDRFELINATINKPAEVTASVIKNAEYSIQLNNLLPNSVLVYTTKSINNDNYSFINFTNKSGTGLRSFVHNDYNTCILNISVDELNAEYRKLANNIYIVITCGEDGLSDEKAYAYYDNDEEKDSYSYINITNENSEETTSVTGNIISAKEGDKITVSIDRNHIMPGYKFEKYIFNLGVDIDEEELSFTFIMDNDYSNQRFEINFSIIEYTLNIYYFDGGQNILEQSNANGKLQLQDNNTIPTSLNINITGEYNFVATANTGYYVGTARIGSGYLLSNLITDNLSEEVTTFWSLNNLNFKEAIIDNVENETQVNLYIYFAIHTYSVKVYFNINENASAKVYPALYINNVAQNIKYETEDGVDKVFVVADGFAYLSNVEFRLNNFVLGTTIKNWSNANMNVLTSSPNYTLNKIIDDTILNVVLQYVPYNINFVMVDEQGADCNYGVVSSLNLTTSLFKRVNYNVVANLGYVLKDVYYYNSLNAIGTENISSGFVFNPAIFKIENGNSVKIYLVFGLKTINLQVKNEIEGNKYYFKNQDINTFVNYSITRTSNEIETPLDLSDSYQFQTGDKLTMQINLLSIGLTLNRIKLNSNEFNNCNITLKEVKDEQTDKTISFMYILEIDFDQVVIGGLDENVVLTNILNVRVYRVVYTYNYIDYNFGIRLLRIDSTGSEYMTPKDDQEMEIKEMGFGTQMTFGYDYAGISSGDGAKFKVDGFTIVGIKQNTQSSFTLKDISLWEEVVLNRYEAKSSDISVVLVLKPKITLRNYTSYSEETGYLYERGYIGQAQGLLTSGATSDIVVGGDFEAIVQYSYDNGASFIDTRPTDVGTYAIKIIAKITSTSKKGPQETRVEFEQKVEYKITPAPLTITLKNYDSTNPIVKVYDGTASIETQYILDNISFNGLYAADLDNVLIDPSRISTELSGSVVNTMMTLYDVNVFGVYIIDKANNSVKNYKLSSGDSLIFSNVTKINPKELKIQGFVPNNKVYDGTNVVVANLEEIRFIGKLANDSAQVWTENLKFYVDDFSVGEKREVKIDWTEALTGADSSNYTIVYDKTYINIHPKEISYHLDGYGTFKVVDEDNLCLIPIGSRMFARAFERGNADYGLMSTLMETQISKREKLRSCYEIVIQVGSMNLSVPEGLFIYIPKVKKVSKVIQAPQDDQAVDLKIYTNEDFIIVKAEEGKAKFGVVTHTIYLPLWVIILIVVGALVAVGIVVMIFILIRRKTKNKYKAFDRI